MNNLKLSLIVSVLLVSILGSSQAFAENVKVQIGTISKGKELIFFDHSAVTVEDATYLTNKTEHSIVCSDDFYVPAYIRVNGNKIQPVCWIPARGDGMGHIVPLGEGLDFYEEGIKFRSATLDLDKKKIR
ncbi:hypothetical protein [Psychrobacter sp. DAB_AL62B]|uniref:hypothetical protein n=1 Tax=Psychrobacter sp. DAB_AL62B TaxID=1028420 RepID=UPI00238154B3|nr:hypothetical protein [Psychrobacter sp. DAB_AL62B]MDE4455273.1 hypothetical protein [Psychrobacter sp. DAB_AL62B]